MSDANATNEDVILLEPGEEEKLLVEGEQDALPASPPLISISRSEDSLVSSDQALPAIEGVIRRQSIRLDELKDQSKLIAEQLRSILDNDEELSQVAEEVKAATRKQKERKTSLANSAASMQLKFKLKELKESIKDIEESLSNHLLNLYQMTGSKEFDTDDGGKREFDVKARLRGKKAQ